MLKSSPFSMSLSACYFVFLFLVVFWSSVKFNQVIGVCEETELCLPKLLCGGQKTAVGTGFVLLSTLGAREQT